MAFEKPIAVPYGATGVLSMRPIPHEDLRLMPHLEKDQGPLRFISPGLKLSVLNGEFYDILAAGDNEQGQPRTHSWGWYATAEPGAQENFIGFSMINREVDINGNINAVQVMNWNEDYWHKGIATAANRAHLWLGFRYLKLGSMCCAMYMRNLYSTRSFANVGFIPEDPRPAMFNLPDEPEGQQSMVLWMRIKNHEIEGGGPGLRRYTQAERARRRALKFGERVIRPQLGA